MGKAAELDEELVNGLKAAKSKRAYFAMVLKGSNDGALIVSKTRVAPTAIAAAKKQSGGSAVVKGFCKYEDGKYVFETAKEAPATAAQAVKIIAKRDAGLTVHAVFRVSTDPELIAGEGDSSATSSRAAEPKQDGAAMMKRVNAMAADIKTALGGPNKDRVRSLFAAVNNQLQNKDFAAAAKTLDELGSLVVATTQRPPPNATLPGADGAAAAAQSSESAYLARVKSLSEDLKKAIASGTAAGNEAKLRFSESLLFSRKKDFAQALALLDAVEVRIKKALAAGSAQPPAGGKAAEPPATAAAVAASGMRRLNGLTPAIKAAMSAGGPNVARIRSLLAAVTGLLKNNDLARADKVLDELELLLTPTTGSGAAASAAEWKTKLAEWTPAIKAAIVAKGLNAAAVLKLLAQASALSKPGGDMVQAVAKLTECHNLATAEAATPAQAATARWNAARAVAVAKLQEEIKVVVATKDPDVGKAELELKAVLKQLNGKMETQQQAAEMDRYLKQDDVVADVCQLAFDLKSPLLEVLGEITPQLLA